MLFQVPNFRRVLCLGAHADDIEIGCGGTILNLIESRPDVEVCWVVLSGDAIRQQEARASFAAFCSSGQPGEPQGNQHRLVTAEFRDGYFPYLGDQVKQFIHQVGEQFAPDLVFSHRREDWHQDHRLVAEVTWQTFRNQPIFEYEIPKYEGDLGSMNAYVPLDESTAGRKIEQLMAHFESQRGKPWFQPETFWSLMRLRGIECKSLSRLAEAFSCRKVQLSFRAAK